MTSIKEFTSSLSNFYQQASNVIVLNAILGKAKSAEEIAKIRRVAIEKGIEPDLARLATYNFAGAMKKLPLFQKEFRKLFSPFFEKDTVSFLEKRESETITKSWSLWYQFAMHPGRHFQDPKGEAFQKLKNVLEQIHKDIRKHFRKLKSAIMNISILHENATWEDSPGLWITFDVANPIDLYESFESIINALKSAIGVVEYNSLKYYALEFWWPTIVIIPLIRGKSLNKTAWKLNALVLSNGTFSEDNWWNYMPHPIPSDSWDMLGLSSWEHPRLDMVNRFHSSMAFFSVFIAHLNDFNRLPELDEKGTNLLQTYVLSLSNKISEALQLFFDSVTEMLNYFNNLEKSEREKRPYLLEAIKMLKNVHDKVTNGKEFHGKIKIELSETKEWIPHLKSALGQVENVRLLWITDILETWSS